MRFEAVNRAAGRLFAQGRVVFSPISQNHPIAEAHGLPKGWEFWQHFDQVYLSLSKELIVLRLPGWEESIGVTAERALAYSMGIPISFIDN